MLVGARPFVDWEWRKHQWIVPYSMGERCVSYELAVSA